MVPKLVLHDWNGCLIDDVAHRFEHSVATIFRHYGLEPPALDDYTHNITSDFMEYYYSRGLPRGADKKSDGEKLNAIMRGAMADSEIPSLFPDTRHFLEELAGQDARQTLVSALVDEEFRRQVGHHDLDGYFAEMHGGIRKKAPVFKDIVDRSGARLESVVGVTDMMSDVVELASIGVRPILLPRGHITPDYAAEPSLIVAKDFRDALDIISRL